VNGSEPGTLIRWRNFKTGSWRGAKGNRAGHTGELFDRRVGCVDIQYRAYPILLRPPIAQMVRRWYRNINLLSIAYAFRPRLRSRL